MTDKVQTKVYLPPELKERIDRDERSNSDVVETAVVEHYGSRDKGAVELRIQNKLDELEAAKRTLESDQENVESIKEEIDRLIDRKQRMESTEEQQRREMWEKAVEHITPPSMRTVDTETWQPDPSDNAVQHYADQLDITPKEFAERYPEKREEYA